MSNNNNSRIIVEENQYPVFSIEETYARSTILNETGVHYNREINAILNETGMHYNREINAMMFELLGEMEEMVTRMGRISEERMIEIASHESLNHYNTQEKKPNVKLDVKSEIASDNLKDEKCVICITLFNVGDKITKLECNHVLHTECVSEWVKYKPECPACRNPIKTKE